MYPPLINTNGTPSSALVVLFQALNLPCGDIRAMGALAQKEFLRKPGEERWHMKEGPHKKKSILPLLRKLGLINEVLPSQEMYTSLDYIFIHGAHVGRIRNRVHFLLTKVWPKLSESTKKRVHIVFLSGDRKLDRETHEKESLLTPEISKISVRPGWMPPPTTPITESEAVRIIWDQMVFDETLRAKILFVDAPRPIDNHRPTTKDTLIMWLASLKVFQKDPNSVSSADRSFWKDAPDLKKENILAISNNPFIPYQDIVFKNFLKDEGFKSIRLETVGDKADPNMFISIHLDNLARYLQVSLEASSN